MHEFALLADWSDLQKRIRNKTMPKGYVDDETGTHLLRPFLKGLSWWPQHSFQMDAGEIWETIRGTPDVPEEMDAAAQEVLNRIFTWKEFWNDLPGSQKWFIVCISPQSAAKLAALAAKVKFRRYRDAYEQKVGDNVKQALAMYFPEKDPFEIFLWYLAKWLRGIRMAAKTKTAFVMGLR
jgi:hypothetical protein